MTGGSQAVGPGLRQVMAGPAGPPGPRVDLFRDGDLDEVPDWLETVLGTDPNDAGDVPIDLDEDGS